VVTLTALAVVTLTALAVVTLTALAVVTLTALAVRLRRSGIALGPTSLPEPG
jgi:hypothetical protein